MNGSVVFALCCCFLLLSACGDLEEKQEEFDLENEGEGYPYYLVIGGGLSETLSVLRVEEGPTFTLYNDVALTGYAIHQAELYGQELYALCSLSNSVVAYDLDLNIQREMSVGAGANPLAMDITEGTIAWVANFLADDVRQVALGPDVQGEERLLAIVPLPAGNELPRDSGVEQSWARPSGLAVIGDRVYVALSNLEAQFVPGGAGLLGVIDPAAASMETIVPLEGRDPLSLQWDAERGVLWVTSAGDYEPGNGFAGNGLLEALDTAQLQIVRRLEVDGAPFEMLLGENGLVYLGNGRDGRLLVMDLDAGEQLASIDLRPEGAELSFISALAFDPDGRLYVAEFNSDMLYVVDLSAAPQVIASFTVNDGPDTLTVIP